MTVGPGDDCSVLSVPASQLVFTTDTQTEGQDFRRQWKSGDTTTGYDVGWKVATQNLADVVSMGAEPITLLVSLSTPPDIPLQWLKDFARGLTDSCLKNGAERCSISGGDLGASTEISVTVTAVGRCAGAPLLRSGAQVGDVVAIAGELGTAAAGFAVMEYSQGFSVDDLDNRPEHILRAVQAQQRPQTPMRNALQAVGVAHAMMDISDGPVRDAQRIAQASKVSIHLETELFKADIAQLEPVADWLTDRSEIQEVSLSTATRWVLSGGENHGMLACFPADTPLPEGFRAVGRCERTHPGSVFVDGKVPSDKGWDHFLAE